MLLLLDAYQSGDQDAGDVLVNGMDRLIKYMIKKYASNLIGETWSFSYIFNECKSAVAAVYKKFSLSEKTAKFSTYFAKSVYNYICTLFKQKQKSVNCLSLDEKVGDDCDSDTFADRISDGIDYEEEAMKNCQLKEIKENVLKLPLIYQSFIKKYFFEHKTLKEISIEEGKNYDTIHSRKKKSISLLKEAVNGTLKYEYCGIVGRTMCITACANKTKSKFLRYKDDIDFEKELAPYLTQQELFVLRYYLNSKIAYSQKELGEKKEFSNNIRNIVALIITKIKKIIKQKEKRKLIYIKYHGEESIKYFSQYLNERHRVVLAEDMLSIKPSSRKDVITKLHTTSCGLCSMNKLIYKKFEKLLTFDNIAQISSGQHLKRYITL